MTTPELERLITDRINERFAALRLTGGGRITVSGGDGSFILNCAPAPVPDNPTVTDEIATGVEQYHAFRQTPPSLQINWALAVNGVRWRYLGALPNDSPHVKIDLSGGKKIYAVVNLTTHAATFHLRPSAVPGWVDVPQDLFTGYTVNSATFSVVNRDVVLPAAGNDVKDPALPGTYEIHALLARFKDDGTEDPVPPAQFSAEEVTGNPYQSGIYGWNLQFSPFQTQALVKFSPAAPP